MLSGYLNFGVYGLQVFREIYVPFSKQTQQNLQARSIFLCDFNSAAD